MCPRSQGGSGDDLGACVPVLSAQLGDLCPLILERRQRGRATDGSTAQTDASLWAEDLEITPFALPSRPMTRWIP